MNAKRRVAAAALGIAAVMALGSCGAPAREAASARVEPVALSSPTPATILRFERVSPRPETYGVGIVVRVTFDQDVPKNLRSSVTSLIDVTSTKPIGKAAWAWSDARTAIYRPKEFWPGHATVTISAAPTYEVIGHVDGADLRWGGSVSSSFRTGPAQVITVNGQTHQATVVRDGAPIRTMPVSLGMPDWETRSGVKVLMEKYEVRQMTSESIGAEEEYELDVPYAIRLTNSGEFIHAAPWATGRLGRTNGSHGCTNLSMADAEWLYHNHLYGDPVVTSGTPRYMDYANGAGGVWNVPWEAWKAGKAA